MTILPRSHARPLEGGPSFSLSHRLQRAFWFSAWAVLAAWTPPPLHGWRRFLLRLFGARVEHGARVYGSARIWFPRNLVMGRHAVLGPRAVCYNQGRVVIKAFATVSQGAHLCTGSHDITDPDFTLVTKPINIESHAWVAAEAFVGPGVNIGEGAVLGARGCAFRSLEPWTVYGGNPARAIGTRELVSRC